MRAMNILKTTALLIITTVPVLFAGCAATEQDRDPDPAEFAADVDRRLDSDPNKRVCRTIRPTGTRLGQRVCKTNYEWAKIEADSRSAISRAQQDQNIAVGGGE